MKKVILLTTASVSLGLGFVFASVATISQPTETQTVEEKYQLSAEDQTFIENANLQAVREFNAKESVSQVVKPSIPTPNQTLAQKAQEIEDTIPGGMGAICSQNMMNITRAEEMLCDSWKGR